MDSKWNRKRWLTSMAKPANLQYSLEELRTKLRQSVKLEHLLSLTDHIAVLQHAKFSVAARKEGYTVDDNARALVFASKAVKLWPDQRLPKFQRKLLSFLLLMQEEDGKFHNFMDFSQRIRDEPTIGDHVGRAVWAAGRVINSDLPRGMRASARLIFDRALPWVRVSTSPRTKAYACLGLHERLRSETKDTNLMTNLKEIADSLVALYSRNRVSDWEWFENILSYDNARLSQALLVAYESMRDKVYLEVAEESLRFLGKVTTVNETYVPIGNKGWYVKGGQRAIYDQQPIEAGAMVEATTLAYKLTGSESYERGIRQALGWFSGLNTKMAGLYDESTGACSDGINEAGANENQGAESTLAFLLAAEAFIQNLSHE
jgi:hypothetical protein